MNNATAATKTTKCRDECLSAKPFSDCNCNCGTACHGRQVCDKELHRFGSHGEFRRVVGVDQRGTLYA